LPFRLSHRKLLVSVVATGIGFVGLQRFPAFVRVYAAFHRLFGISLSVTQDVTDPYALPFLVIAYAVGRRSLGRLS
jgi:hypothetical protein